MNFERVILIGILGIIYYFGYKNPEFFKTFGGAMIGLISSITIIGFLWVTRNE